MGIALFPCSLNHAKGVIADRKRGALFSANFDAQRGIDSGVELGTRLDGTAALDAALGFFEHSITERDLDYVRDPTAGELAATIFSRRVSPWPWPTTIHLTTSDTDWTRLKDATQGPTLFVTGTEGTELYAGRRAWQLTMSSEPTSPTPARLVGLNDRQPVAADARLAQWLTAREPKDAHRGTRGICPASLHRVDPPEGGATWAPSSAGSMRA
jgi:hypothetical protein